MSIFSETIEKVLEERFACFLGKLNILSKKQFGFMDGYLTEDGIYYIKREGYYALEREKPELCIFVDLSEAFDTVSHAILLEKLDMCRMRGTVLNLITSYLTDRNHLVNVDGVLSEARPVTCEPEGSILGLQLFSTYVNSLMEAQTRETLFGFFDDLAVLYRSNT